MSDTNRSAVPTPPVSAPSNSLPTPMTEIQHRSEAPPPQPPPIPGAERAPMPFEAQTPKVFPSHSVPKSHTLVAEVAALQASHVVLSIELNELKSELMASRDRSVTDLPPGIREKQYFDLKSRERTLMFARNNATMLLKSYGTEISRSYRSLCASNVVRQVLLRSKRSDCTLQEFQVVANNCMDNPAISCSVYPSDYYVRFPSNARASRFEIFFDTFVDYCEALKISVHDREAGMLRFKKKRGSTTRTGQVLGVEVVNEMAGAQKERRILLGRSIAPASMQESVPVMHQTNTDWSEGSCEHEFQFRCEGWQKINEVLQHAVRQRTTGCDRISDLDTVPSERRYFALVWDRVARIFPNSSDIYPEHVPGTLRSFLPAVAVRSTILTNSTDTIFKTRLNGIPLIQHLVSPPTRQFSNS